VKETKSTAIEMNIYDGTDLAFYLSSVDETVLRVISDTFDTLLLKRALEPVEWDFIITVDDEINRRSAMTLSNEIKSYE
jgi:hypothetical protein